MLPVNLQPLADLLTVTRVKLSELSQIVRAAGKAEMIPNGEGEPPRPGKLAISSRAVTTLAFRNIELAFMWLGKCKSTIGCENPYPASTDPASPVIEKAVDTFQGEIRTFDDETVFTKTIRSELGEQEFALRHSAINANGGNAAYKIAIAQAYVLIQNAKMYLGLVLGEIRDERPAPALPAPEGLPELNTDDLQPEPGAKETNLPVDAPTPVEALPEETQAPQEETNSAHSFSEGSEVPAPQAESPAPGDEEAQPGDTQEEAPQPSKAKGGKKK